MTRNAEQGARQLSALLMLDVVDYSGQMHADEGATLRALKALTATVVEPRVARFGGRIVKRTGDGALIAFTSVVAAVSFGVSVQHRLSEASGASEPRRAMKLRIGIHVADVIAEAGDLFGDGVNVAARLEALAPPGGILISRAVRDQILDRLDLTLEDRGDLTLKNIPRPVRAFCIVVDEKAAELAAQPALPRRFWQLGWPRLAVVVLAALSLAVAIPLVSSLKIPSPFSDTGTSAGRPAIAVLPFSDLSPAHDQAIFSAGVAGEILATLSRSPYLRVISRNSSFSQEIAGLSPDAVGRRLGVRYLLSGSAQRDAKTLRLSVELIEASGGATLWAESFDRPLSGAFAVQDEIAVAVAARLDDRIQRAELIAASRKPPADTTTYDAFLKARSIMASDYGKEATLTARKALEQAVKLDPTWAPPHAWLAFTYYREVSRSWQGARREAALDIGETEARRALELDPTLAFANLTMANLMVRRSDYEAALRWAEKAITLDPNDSDALAAKANILAYVNRAEEAIPLMRRAFELDPIHPPLFDMYLGKSLTLSGDFSEAVSPLKDCLQRVPDSWPCHQYLAVSLLNLGQRDEADAQFRMMQRNYPFRSIADHRARGGFLPGAQSHALYAALAELGLPAESD